MLGLAPPFFTQRGVRNTAALALNSSLSQCAIYPGPSADYAIGGTEFTLEQWVRHPNLGGIQGYQGAGGSFQCWRHNGFAPEARININGAFSAVDQVGWDFVPVANEYIHTAFTWDGTLTVGTGALKFFINGVDQGAPATVFVNDGVAALSAPTSTYTVGSWNGGASAYFNGLIDEVRLWTVARTGPEILANYNREIDPATLGLRNYFQWNGDVYTDVASGFNLVGVNAPVFSTIVPFAFSP